LQSENGAALDIPSIVNLGGRFAVPKARGYRFEICVGFQIFAHVSSNYPVAIHIEPVAVTLVHDDVA
jgi:hypothetical protein